MTCTQRGRVAVLVAGALLAAAPAAAWGPAVHRAVTAKAIDTLPGELKNFYKNHRLELPTLALDSEEAPPEEGQERRFAVDRVLAFPFLDLPRTERAFKQRFPESADAVGRLPWLVHESYDRLVEAFRSGEKDRILQESDLLAGLVTDLQNPLALTENADGQKTGQHGLWVRLGVRFPELAEKALKLEPDAAHLLDAPKDYVFLLINGSYVWVDNLLYLEEVAKRGKSAYTEIYYEALALRATPVVRQRLSDAARDAGSYWYTAWTAAGRPALR